MLSKLKQHRPSPAMVVALVALVAALGGTAYAAGQINGNSIQKQSIGAGKLEKKTLTGFQINTDKLGVVPAAEKADNVFWAVVDNPAGVANATLARTSNPGTTAVEANGVVTVTFPFSVSACADVASRNNAGTTSPGAGTAQTNASPADANAIEVHTFDDKGQSNDSDFHLLVVCP